MPPTHTITRRLLRLACATALAAPLLASTAEAKAPLDMVALGDSYSAGVGLGAVTAGCDRDKGAYGPRAQKEKLGKASSKPKVELSGFVACSGATIDQVKAKQLKSINPSTDIATITVGGNDIGFADKTKSCVVFICDLSTFALQPDILKGDGEWDALYQKLASTYAEMRYKMNARGHLYVLTYPIPFSRRQDLLACWGFDAVEQNAANALVVRLDDTIYWAVQRANQIVRDKWDRPGNVHMVDWRSGTRVPGGYTAPGSRTFDSWISDDGHCNWGAERDVFLNGVVAIPLANVNNSFHPNAVGYRAAAQRLAGAIKTHQK